MVTFRRATLLFFLLLLCINVVRFAGCPYAWISGHFCEHYSLYAILLLFLYLGISVALAFVIRSDYHHKALCHRKTEERVCTLTFDDGPHPTFTPAILEILNDHGIAATFFIIGSRINGNESLLQAIDRGGHLIGNHSWSHSPWFDFWSARLMRRDILRTTASIKAVTGKEPRLFRPPFGVINPMVSKAIRPLDYDVIGWNIRSLDTLSNPEKVVKRIIQRITPGSVILLHDHLPSSAKTLTLLLEELKRNDYRIIPLTELFTIKSYA